MAGSIIAKIKPEGGIHDEGKENETDAGLVSAAEDMISAMHMKDAKALADAMKAAFEIMESMPHEEGEHIAEEEE